MEKQTLMMNRYKTGVEVSPTSNIDRGYSISPQAYLKNAMSNIPIIERRNTIDASSIKATPTRFKDQDLLQYRTIDVKKDLNVSLPLIN